MTASINRRAFEHALKDLRCSADEHGAVVALSSVSTSLGADYAMFVCLERAPSLVSMKLLAVCDPRECVAPVHLTAPQKLPWIEYALRHTEPHITQWSAESDSTSVGGMRSVYVVPAPSPALSGHDGVLILGSKSFMHFEVHEDFQLRAFARAAAMEFREWWAQLLQARLIDSARLTDEDFDLLRYEAQQLGSRQVARRMKTTVSAVDSRWKRLNARMHTRNRRSSAELAVRFGLLEDLPLWKDA